MPVQVSRRIKQVTVDRLGHVLFDGQGLAFAPLNGPLSGRDPAASPLCPRRRS